MDAECRERRQNLQLLENTSLDYAHIYGKSSPLRRLVSEPTGYFSRTAFPTAWVHCIGVYVTDECYRRFPGIHIVSLATISIVPQCHVCA